MNIQTQQNMCVKKSTVDNNFNSYNAFIAANFIRILSSNLLNILEKFPVLIKNNSKAKLIILLLDPNSKRTVSGSILIRSNINYFLM